MTAAQEFVVPRSMPMTFAIQFSTASGRRRSRDLDHRRPKEPVVQEVALLEHLKDGARRDVPRLLPDDRLVHVGVEREPERGHLGQPVSSGGRLRAASRSSRSRRGRRSPSRRLRSRGGGAPARSCRGRREDREKTSDEREPEVLALLAFRSAASGSRSRPSCGEGPPAAGRTPPARSEAAPPPPASFVAISRSSSPRPAAPPGARAATGGDRGAPRPRVAMLLLGGRDGALGLGERAATGPRRPSSSR